MDVSAIKQIVNSELPIDYQEKAILSVLANDKNVIQYIMEILEYEGAQSKELLLDTNMELSRAFIGKPKYNGQLELPNVTGGGVKISKKNDGTRFPISIHRYSQNWRRQEQIHPTQKPVELLEYLVKTYTNEGDTVLDNTMGSGTTNLACIKLNRKSIGIEKEKQYYDVAVRRLSSYCG